MYVKCKLVHADLSEYNMLWYKNVLYIIDVSQSVRVPPRYYLPQLLRFARKNAVSPMTFIVFSR